MDADDKESAKEWLRGHGEAAEYILAETRALSPDERMRRLEIVWDPAGQPSGVDEVRRRWTILPETYLLSSTSPEMCAPKPDPA